MRIRTDGKFAYREELIDNMAEQLGENTRVVDVEYAVSTGVSVE